VVLSDRQLVELKLRAERAPANASLQLELADAYERAGLHEAASQAYQRVLALDPGNGAASQGRLRHFRRAYADAGARGNGYERAAVVHQVGELAEPAAIVWLLGLLDDPEPVVCQKAAEALGKIGDRAAVPGLVRLLRSDAACAWWQAAEALAAVGDRAAVAPLLRVLADGSPNARAAAAHALGCLRDSSALEPLASALAAGEAPLRRAAAAALADLGDPAAVPALATALDDPDPDTRAAAVAAVGKLAERPFRASVLHSAERAARRWWEKTGRFRHWGRRAPAQAALAARVRRHERDDRRALLVGAATVVLALLGVAAVGIFLSIVLGLAPSRPAPAPAPTTAESR
jgi:HEAT repeat protein